MPVSHPISCIFKPLNFVQILIFLFKCCKSNLFLTIIPIKKSNSVRIVLPVTHPVTGNIVAFT